MPRPLVAGLLILVALSLVPLAYFALARRTDSTEPRIQVVYDMDAQPRPGAQAESAFFADGRSARPPVAGTVARGALRTDRRYLDGHIDSVFVDAAPLPITRELLERGRERFDIFCAACHGLAGAGDGTVHVRAVALGEATWTRPADLTAATTVERPVGEIFTIISDGVRNMPAFRSQLATGDRWAIASYVRALQRAAHGTIDDVPADARSTLR